MASSFADIFRSPFENTIIDPAVMLSFMLKKSCREFFLFFSRAHSNRLCAVQDNFNLLQNLKEREKRKLLKTIPLDQEWFLSNNTRDLPINTATQARRYCGLHRLVRKRKLFRRKRRLLNTTTSNVPHQLDPINLSNMSISQDQINLLKKWPSFCPMPKDVDWQRVYDDLEAFDLRTAVLKLTLKIVKDHLGCLPFGQKIRKFWFEVKW